MISLATGLAVGFLLGMKHATEADHVAAVATLATRGQSVGQTIRIGIAWGCGHTLTLMVFAGAVLTLGLGVPQRAAQALELAVGVMLVLLGADVLRRLRRGSEPRRHYSGARLPAQTAWPRVGQAEDVHRDHPAGGKRRALVVGMVHGMAGSAALILLSLEAMHSALWGVAYIAVFGFGSILGMAALSLAIALPLHLSARRMVRAQTALCTLIALSSVALGLVVVFENALG